MDIVMRGKGQHLEWLQHLQFKDNSEANEHPCDYCMFAGSNCPVLKTLVADESFQTYFNKAKEGTLHIMNTKLISDAIDVEHFAMMQISDMLDNKTCPQRKVCSGKAHAQRTIDISRTIMELGASK